MRGRPQVLVNTAEIELWPGGTLRARSNRDARALSRARAVLRRKRDGAYLAADLPEGLLPLVPGLVLAREPGIDEALAALGDLPVHARPGGDVIASLPVGRLQERLDGLGIDAGLGLEVGKCLCP